MQSEKCGIKAHSCQFCGKKFTKSEVLSRHQRVCERVHNFKVMKKNPSEDLSVQYYNDEPCSELIKPKQILGRKVPNDNMSIVSKMNPKNKGEGKVVPMRDLESPTSLNEANLVVCPICRRRFTENVFDKHVALCKKKKEHEGGMDYDENKKKLEMRTKYKPSAGDNSGRQHKQENLQRGYEGSKISSKSESFSSSLSMEPQKTKKILSCKPANTRGGNECELKNGSYKIAHSRKQGGQSYGMRKHQDDMDSSEGEQSYNDRSSYYNDDRSGYDNHMMCSSQNQYYNDYDDNMDNVYNNVSMRSNYNNKQNASQMMPMKSPNMHQQLIPQQPYLPHYNNYKSNIPYSGASNMQLDPMQHHNLTIFAPGIHESMMQGLPLDMNIIQQQQVQQLTANATDMMNATLQISTDAMFNNRLSPSVSIGNASLAKFCHECGAAHVSSSARFCTECGTKRVM